MRQNYDDRKIVKQYREIARQIVKKEAYIKIWIRLNFVNKPTFGARSSRQNR